MGSPSCVDTPLRGRKADESLPRMQYFHCLEQENTQNLMCIKQFRNHVFRALIYFMEKTDTFLTTSQE